LGTAFCPELGICVPVGKDSLSMKTVWQENGLKKEVLAPVSLVITAFAPVIDARATLTPQLRGGETVLALFDLGSGRCRAGGSALAQVYRQLGDTPPDADDAGLLRAFFQVIQDLNARNKILAYHDRSDGGLIVSLCEMMFAGRLGIDLVLDGLCVGNGSVTAIAALFNEELGAVVQLRVEDLAEVKRIVEEAGLQRCFDTLGTINDQDVLRITHSGKEMFRAGRADLQRVWSETGYQMQRLRDNPGCALEEYDRIALTDDPGLTARLGFDPDEDIAAAYINKRPRVAVLREQGVNGHVEMAAAFDRAGFEAMDVHMSDIVAGRLSLRDFQGFAACGGFSFGDVLGAGRGWANSILFNPRARNEFEAFFERGDSFALGVCNGCQMMSHLAGIIPGADAWPRFERNHSEQFEARLVMVEVVKSPSLFFDGMDGSRIPIVVSHGEGRAVFDGDAAKNDARVALRFIDQSGAIAKSFPFNPNGSPDGITGLTTPDGRFTILMPHPERVFRTVQHSWHPDDWGEDGPWLRIFRNARRWVG
ncbi:MAG: phosphoribosylformylglycinamidine synthase, partial [Burkholderiales bacterium]